EGIPGAVHARYPADSRAIQLALGSGRSHRSATRSRDRPVGGARRSALEAARRFDEGRGVSFRRFANYRVRGAMLDGIRKSAPLPRRAHARVRALEASLLISESKAEDAPSGMLPASPDARASEEKLTEHLADMATAMAMGLLASPVVGDEGEPTALDTAVSPEEAFAQAELRKLVVDALEDLPEDERTLVRRH